MAKIKLVKWQGSNGELAISFPSQPLCSHPTPIVRQAHVAAAHAAMMMTIHWNKTIGNLIDHPIGVSYKQHQLNVDTRQKKFRGRALRRYKNLFKAMGMK